MASTLSRTMSTQTSIGSLHSVSFVLRLFQLSGLPPNIGSFQLAFSLQHAVDLCALLSCGGTESADAYVMYLRAVD